MKGIILAGGSGTRLYPVTQAVIKQLLPVYDKPMIYYPLSTLMLAGIRDILIISTPKDTEKFRELLGTGEQLGCSFTYAVQERPRGLADAYIVGEQFIGNDSVGMILGDNLFHGVDMGQSLKQYRDIDGAVGFAVRVKDPERYGVYEFDASMNVLSIEEKPEKPKSNYANAGLYFTDNSVIEIAKGVQPSPRGEVEIVSVLEEYLHRGKLKVSLLGRGTAWLDTGTFEAMHDATKFVEVIQARTGLKVGCIEEVAWREGFINDEQVEKLAMPFIKSGYGKYLLELLKK